MTIDIDALTTKVEEISLQVDHILKISSMPELRCEYQRWYSQVHHLVAIYVSGRLQELENLYYTPSTAYSVEAETAAYIGIRSYLRGGDKFRLRFEADFEQQRGILISISDIVGLRALEVAALVTADLVKNEIDEARLLLNHGFIRAAGAIAGVALEAHLKLLHHQSGLSYEEQDTIIPLSSRLRQKDIISLGDEKKCIAMSDTRNKCDHKKSEEPTVEEVNELIDDVDRFTKRVQVT